MRIFLTGATGFVGSAIVPELLNAGHQVLGLARSDKAAAALAEAGAEPHRGDLEDLDSLRRGAADADAIIHTGFIHDFTRFAEMCEVDRRAIGAMGEVLMGTDKPFLITSGIGLFNGSSVTETDEKPVNPSNPRIATEQEADRLAALGVRTALVRLPPSTHGPGDHHGFVPILIRIAREKGVSVYSSADNSWCAVHRLDAAKLYRLAVERKDAAPGTRYHAVAEGHLPFKAIAEAIAEQLNIPAEEKSPEESAANFAWFAHFAAMNISASSEQTQNALGWKPTHDGLLEDIRNGVYDQE